MHGDFTSSEKTVMKGNPMKGLSLALLIGIWSMSAFAQGTVNFINIVGSLNAPDFSAYGTTKLSCPGFTAELIAGPSA